MEEGEEEEDHNFPRIQFIKMSRDTGQEKKRGIGHRSIGEHKMEKLTVLAGLIRRGVPVSNYEFGDPSLI